MALGRGLCTKQEREKCEAEFGENIEWTCANCPKKSRDDLHPYTLKLLGLVNLQGAGYPLHANDLTLEEWTDLARVKTWLEQRREKERLDQWLAIARR
ncbi:MAG: hypothetical protein ACNI3A_18750 [Desulfovibrio sp.]|uniref:hypothetical protein n=1 Tax=Desulfovibrio sp. 7SRBS1 TaxID=3378064 RepID=UPI003B3C8916